MTKSLTYVEVDVPKFTYNALLHFDGADASTTITDSSGLGTVWTVAGNAQLDTAQSQFGGSSLLLDGTGDYVTAPATVGAVGTVDFTVECWIRLNVLNAIQLILSCPLADASIALSLYVNSDNTVHFFTGGSDRIAGTTVLTTGKWYRVSLARVGTSTRLFLNGVQDGATYADTNDYNVANCGPTTIGAKSSLTPPFYFNGWIDEFSIVAGKQTFRFATDTAYLPLTVDAVPPVNINTTLHFDGADASTTIVDSNGVTWTAGGNAQLDTAQSQAGGSSLLLDGTDDYVSGPASVLAVGTADFTIDFYIRFNATGDELVLDGRAANGSLAIVLYTSSAKMTFFTQGADRISGTTTLSTGVWYRITLSRVGTATRLFLNGAQEGATYTDTNNYALSEVGATVIGGRFAAPYLSTNGWIDEFSVVASKPTVDAVPSIKSVQIDPAIVGLGTDLGQRATVTVTFRDHRYKFAGESFSSGTFWGKFRARYGLSLRGRPLRLYRGTLGQTLPNMERRLFLVESVDGPSDTGEYKIIAKDVLKFADDDRSQAPFLSNGFLASDISNSATSCTLSPTGVGNSEYPTAQFFVAIGGSEICFVTTRSGDTLNFETSPSGRAQFNTTAVAHTAGDRVQRVYYFNGNLASDIIAFLLQTHAGVPVSYVPKADWNAEDQANLGVVYTAVICEPTGVATLISELIEQAALALWWDDVNQLIRFQVLRSVAGSSSFTMENIVQSSLRITEQPDKRLSQVIVYFGKINPLLAQDQIQNYRSTSLSIDAKSEVDYGSASVKKIYSRWIPAGGRTTAQTLGNKQLGRYRDPPRRFNFDLLRYAQDDPSLGGGYNLQSWQLQDVLGNSASVPVQIFRLNPGADKWGVEAEEMLWTPFGGDTSLNTHTIVFDASENNVNLRTRHDQLYPAPVSGNVVNAFVNSGVIIGSTSTANPAFDVGSWPAGVTVTLTVSGRIEGCGGVGGQGAGFLPTFPPSFDNAHVGGVGGVALYTRKAISLTSTAGAIWGGGGGGGGGGASSSPQLGGCGGGGGAGRNSGGGGAGGAGTNNGIPGSPGTDTTGGAGGFFVAFPTKGPGGSGGGPGLGGNGGGNGDATTGAVGGVNGAGVDGTSFTTDVGAPGDIRGGRIN